MKNLDCWDIQSEKKIEDLGEYNLDRDYCIEVLQKVEVTQPHYMKHQGNYMKAAEVEVQVDYMHAAEVEVDYMTASETSEVEVDYMKASETSEVEVDYMNAAEVEVQVDYMMSEASEVEVD